ncbi:MAG: tetratricopeptide repeat protein [Gammaproteobacteria bacterium]|nr:tetratricopeptide repeat protein [Gammaproteobacteria bacterium]
MTTIVNGRYHLQNKLGGGGMGIVHRTHDRLTGSTVALKQVQIPVEALAFMSMPSETIRQNIYLALGREFQILAGLRHPHIISVLDYGFVAGEDGEIHPFYTMTYLPHANTLLEAGTGLSVSGKLGLIQQILQGLVYLHRRDILHRDLKPENVLVVEGQVRILDFGLAQRREEARESSSGGSMLYLAPELWEQSASPASDLYALGVMAYELLAGQHPFAPFDGDFAGRVFNDDPDLSRLEVDEAVAEVVGKLLAKTPETRYQQAQKTLAALDAALGDPSSGESETVRESYLQAATFVGRKAEMAQLTEAMATAEHGAGAVWLVGGESEVGKSRLLEEIRTRALVAGWQVLTGQAVAEGGVPYQLWRESVPRLVLGSELSDLEAGVLREIAPDIDQLLERAIVAPPKLSGGAAQQRLVLTLVDVLKRQSQPTLLLLEDLQWTRESLVPLKQMLKVLPQLPGVMVIGSYRDDERPDLPDELPGAKRLPLPRLDMKAITSLTMSMLGGEIIQRSNIVQLLHRETEGNTFFVVEVMRALAEEAGQLDKVAQMTLPAGVFTGGMASLLQRRIQRVAAADQPLLQLAAVAGRELDMAIVRALARGVNIGRWLQRISDAAILTVRDNQWLFSHDKLRQTILTQMTVEQQREGHRQVAMTIEQVYPEDSQYDVILLAHWQGAGDEEKELVYLLPVAQQLIQIRGDHEQGRTLLNRGLELLSQTDGRRVALLNLKASSYWRQGRHDEGQDVAQQAHDLAQQTGDQSGLAESLNQLGVTSSHQRNYPAARDYHQQSLAIRQTLNDQHGIARSLNNLGVIADYQGDYGTARDYCQQSLSIYQAIGDQQGIADCLVNLGELCGSADPQGDYTSAYNYYQQSLAIYQALGDQWGIGISLNNLGFVQLHLRSEQARSSLHKALVIAQNLQATPLILEAVMGFAWLYMHENQPSRAEELAGLASHHPIFGGNMHLRLDGLLPQLEEALSASELEAALERGKTLDLDTVVAELLAEFAEDNT